MLTYNPNSPLVYIHLYKTAGSTMKHYYMNWFPYNFIEHHDFPGTRNITCTQENIDLFKKRRKQNNPVFYGHFNSFGDYNWPEDCTQFITTVRDPYDMAISAFYYADGENNPNFKKYSNNIEDYILNSPFEYRLTKVFSKEKFTLKNYKDLLHKYFIVIGSLKNFNKSIATMKNCLQINNDLVIDPIRITSNKKTIPEHLKEIHREKWELEYAIYDYVNKYFNY